MAQDKGKALARWSDERSPDTAEETFVGRVSSSAAGLLRSAVLQPSAAQATSSLASSSFTSEKSQSSSSHTGSDVSATHSSDLGSELRKSSRNSLSNPSGEPFRSAEYMFENVNSDTEAEFDAFGQTAQLGRIESESATEMKIRPFDESIYQITSKNAVLNPTQPGSCYSSADEWKLEEHDGASVVALLSDSSWDLEDRTSNMGISEELSDSKTMFGIPFETKEVLERIKLELPPPPFYRVPSPMNPLNLRPDFTSDCKKHIGDGMMVIPTMAPRYGEKSCIHMTVDEPIGIQELEPWLDVLTNYQDEVWGDVASVVKEVKEEVRNARENNLDVIDSTAVRRLGMILGHLKMPATFAARNS